MNYYPDNDDEYKKIALSGEMLWWSEQGNNPGPVWDDINVDMKANKNDVRKTVDTFLKQLKETNSP